MEGFVFSCVRNQPQPAKEVESGGHITANSVKTSVPLNWQCRLHIPLSKGLCRLSSLIVYSPLMAIRAECLQRLPWLF